MPTARPCADGKLAGILPAIAARLFLHLLAATWRGPGVKQRKARLLPQKLQGRAKRRLPLLWLFAPGSLCEAAKVGWKRPRTPYAGRARDGAHSATGQEPCRRTPADRSEPAAPPPARNRGCISLVTFFVQAKKVTRPPGRRTETNRDEGCVRVTRAQKKRSRWVPAFAGTTNGTRQKSKWIPAFAGMTE